MAGTRRRVLFVAEAVSLAHVARPVVLASALAGRHDVSVASAPAFDLCFKGTGLARQAIESISASRFLERLAAGEPLYARAELERYVEQDVELIRQVNPDVIVGDFRLSLSVSARVAGVPYFALCNAHWSPWAAHSRFPLPDITLTRVLGPKLAEPLFRLAQPLAFRLHAGPLNAVRRKYRLGTFPDVRHAYTDGDHTLYADTPSLVPVRADCPAHHHFIGPIVWSPDMPYPDWWSALPAGALAYVTLGSTGRVDLLPEVFRALEAENVNAMTATAGRSDLASPGPHCFVADFLPGIEAAGRADFVICNGGSATVYQTLSRGRPVIGLCSNMDQFLTMARVSEAGAGIALRAGNVSYAELRSAIARMASGEHGQACRAAAERVRTDFLAFDPGQRLAELVDRVIS